MPLEQDKANGFRLTLQAELATGLHLSQFARSVPLWADGQNVQFSPLGVEKLPGWEQIATTGNAEPIRGILQQDESATKVLYVGDLSQLYHVEMDSGTVAAVGSGYNLSESTGGSEWDSGTTTWDSGATVWDGGLVFADHWSLINYGSFILATSGADAPQIRKARDFVDMPAGVTGITVVGGGSGYVVGEVLTLTGGDGSGATAEVTSVDGGAITGVTMTDAGSGYTTVPTGHTSSAAGTGATFTFTVCDMDVSSVEIFLTRGPHILGFNTSVSGKEVIWCDADDPDTWVTASDNLAGALQLRELKSDIRAAVPLGSRIAVYGDDQMFLLSYLGNQLVFGYQPALDGIGAVSKKSVVPVGNKNYGLSSQGFFITDGASFQYIDGPAVRRWFDENAAAGQLSKSIAFHDEENTQVRWYFPTTSVEITEGLAFNYQLGAWSRITADRTAGQERTVASHPVSGDSTGALFLEGQGNNAHQSAMTAYVRSKPIDLGDADRVKELDSIRLGLEGDGLQYRVGWSETENGAVTWGSYSAFPAGFDFDNLRTAGRWLHFELYSDTLNADWEVMNVEFIGRVEGSR
jgi:hypothetical protein